MMKVKRFSQTQPDIEWHKNNINPNSGSNLEDGSILYKAKSGDYLYLYKDGEWVIMNGVNKFMQDSKLYQISKFDKNIHNKIGAAGAVIGGFVGSLPGLAMGNLKTAATGAVIGSTISGLYSRNKAKKRAENIVKDYESKYGKNAYTTFMKKK